MKKAFSFFVLFLCCLPVAAYGLDVPRLQGYVNDYAGMISPSVKSRIVEELRAFEQSDSTQIVLLTIPSLEGENIEEFGIKVAERWKIGQQQKDNGGLLIVSKEERKIRIEVGRGLEGKLTDLMAGRIIDQVITPRFRQGDFDAGFAAAVSSLIAATRGEFKADERPAQRRQRVSSSANLPSVFRHLYPFSRNLLPILGESPGSRTSCSCPSFCLPLSCRIIILALVGFGAGFFLSGLFLQGISRRAVGRLQG
jgi:uncharacterized protein